MKANKKLLLVAILTSFAGSSISAELTELQQRVIADSEKVKTLNAAERREFRKQIWNNEDPVAQRAYNRAYKEMAEAGLITFKKSNSKKSNVKVVNSNQINSRRGGGVQPTPNMITYHSGVLSAATTADSFTVGNRFNTGGGFPVANSASITMVTIDMASINGNTTASGSAFVSFYDQITGTAANLVDSSNTPLQPGMNNISVVHNYIGNEFIAGVWKFGGDVINVASGTVGGQGFHGIVINDVVGTGLTTIPNMNAAIGVSGPVTTPVELLNFSVE